MPKCDFNNGWITLMESKYTIDHFSNTFSNISTKPWNG